MRDTKALFDQPLPSAPFHLPSPRTAGRAMWVDFFVSPGFGVARGKRFRANWWEAGLCMKGFFGVLSAADLWTGCSICLGLDSGLLLPGPLPESLLTSGGSSSLELVTLGCCTVDSLLLS